MPEHSNHDAMKAGELFVAISSSVELETSSSGEILRGKTSRRPTSYVSWTCSFICWRETA